MRARSTIAFGLVVSVLTTGVVATALAADKPTGETVSKDGVRRDPKGRKGISPFWEQMKKGDDAVAAHDLTAAHQAYDEAVHLEPRNGHGHYRLGEVQLAEGNQKDAEASWQSALRFAGEEPGLKGKILFVLADLKERQRSLDEAKNGWTAYDTHAKAHTDAKLYPDVPTERKKRIDTWKQLETDYAAVKERIKQRLQEAEKKAAESAQSPQNR